jgi:hypothetical protein
MEGSNEVAGGKSERREFRWGSAVAPFEAGIVSGPCGVEGSAACASLM